MSLKQDQIDVTLSHYTPTPYNQCPYHVSTSYTSESSEIQPGQAFSLPNTHPPIWMTWVKTKSTQPLKAVG